MKRLCTILLVLTALLSAKAQTVGNILHFYLHDGTVMAVPRFKLSLISYTSLAADDSRPYDGNVAAHEVYWENNGDDYRWQRIDLNRIDSASFVVPVKPAEAVDLGLSVKWASYNVGAATPESYGIYVSWGEMAEKDTYDGDHDYQWGTKRPDYQYDMVDIGKDISGIDYDVARQLWGGTWRMPTHEEWQELKEKCTATYEQLNQVPGARITGPNGNSIFLPYAGYIWPGVGANPSKTVTGYDREGEYWSASQHWKQQFPFDWSPKVDNDQSAFSFGISGTNPDANPSMMPNNGFMKQQGLTVRPVCE